MQVKWHPPEHPWIKINTDGAVQPATDNAGGGVIRDHSGKIIVAFATPLNAHSALEAELRAIIHGITVAKDLGRPMWIESDSEQAIKLINSNDWGPAPIRQDMACLAILKKQYTIRATFIHREGNKAADWLAKWGMEQPNFCSMNYQTVPRMLKAIARMDEMGIPNIRVHNEDFE